ncbi:MAG: RIP metalloprotease RseP [Patescibacteria group bacterium UBA2163]
MTILLFIGILLLLIVGHELGHFLVAKKSGMRVDEFGVGFPPKIFGKKIGETEYTVNWLPFGGFVKIFGEDSSEKKDPRAFASRPALHQAAVLFAGPFANIVIAFVLSSVAFMVGTPALIDSEVNKEHARDVSVVVVQVSPESPAAEAGLMSGDRIVAVGEKDNVTSITDPQTVTEHISAALDSAVVFTIRRSGEEQMVSVIPQQGVIDGEPERYGVGIATAQVGTVSYPLHEALWQGIVDTARDFVFVLVSLVGLIAGAITFSADVSNLAGPVGIASLTGDAAAFGFGSLLSFAALLSVNLAIINLLPFPALDGGRLVFVAIESITRRPVPNKISQIVNTIGFLILILLMVAVTVGDISRLIG